MDDAVVVAGVVVVVEVVAAVAAEVDIVMEADGVT